MRGCIILVNLEALGWWLIRAYFRHLLPGVPVLNVFGHFHTPKSANCLKWTKINPFLWIPHACYALLKDALATLCLLNIWVFLKKEGATEKGGLDFEIGGLGAFVNLCWWLKKLSCRACLLFYGFLVTKKIKVILTCSFIFLPL